MGIANRDIKLENILLSSSEYKPLLKMCDFGYSINTDHSAPETAVGTPEYTGALHACLSQSLGHHLTFASLTVLHITHCASEHAQQELRDRLSLIRALLHASQALSACVRCHHL